MSSSVGMTILIWKVIKFMVPNHQPVQICIRQGGANLHSIRSWSSAMFWHERCIRLPFVLRLGTSKRLRRNDTSKKEPQVQLGTVPSSTTSSWSLSLALRGPSPYVKQIRRKSNTWFIVQYSNWTIAMLQFHPILAFISPMWISSHI